MSWRLLAAIPLLLGLAALAPAQEKTLNAGPAQCLYFSPDAKLFGLANISSAQLHLELYRYPGLQKLTESEYEKTSGTQPTVFAMAISPDARNRTWATASGQEVWLWDWLSKTPKKKFEVSASPKFSGAVMQMDFLDEDALLLAGLLVEKPRPEPEPPKPDPDKPPMPRPEPKPPEPLKTFGFLKVLDPRTLEELSDFKVESPIRTWQWSPKRDSFSFLDQKGVVHVWSVEKKDKKWELKETSTVEGPAGALCYAFSPNGKKLVVGCADRTVRVWDVAAEKEIIFCEGHTDQITFVAFTPDGESPISWSRDGTVRMWGWDDRMKPVEVAHWKRKCDRALLAPDGKTVATASDEDYIRFWDLEAMARAKTKP